MSRIVYVNGEFLPEEEAKISVFDRGFLFADGIYEVSTVIKGKMIDNAAHMARLRRSMNELNMPSPASDEEITEIQAELLVQNNIENGLIYLQITRGAADRDFVFPKEPKPSLVMFTQVLDAVGNPKAERGISVITVDDVRWKRRDIKTVALLAQSMAKQAAVDAGADDAWMVEDGFITEGTSNNAFIITKDDKIITRNLSNDILHGITRQVVLELAAEKSLVVEERPFTLEEALDAKEAFVTSATAFVMPVVRINEQPLGNGGPGILSSQLRAMYIKRAMEA
ncbi:MAG: D-amino acid aminotransferase [Hyphomicrobiales bacterium]|nr:MAG: D-amino acid aminotransferase [Hyphomicrobiales bacterium]